MDAAWLLKKNEAVSMLAIKTHAFRYWQEYLLAVILPSKQLRFSAEYISAFNNFCSEQNSSSVDKLAMIKAFATTPAAKEIVQAAPAELRRRAYILMGVHGRLAFADIGKLLNVRRETPSKWDMPGVRTIGRQQTVSIEELLKVTAWQLPAVK